MASLFRRPTVGLALGGGGARGLAHIGVLKVLENEGVIIDYLAGSSMGGLIAGLYAAEIPISEIESEAISLSKVSELIKLLDLTPFRRGLLNGERVRAYLEDILGEDRLMENLRLPLALTAVDLLSRKEVILSHGSLIEAMIATSCVPGLFTPIEKDNCLLIDGSVLNNVPGDVARKLGAEVIIAVDVNYLLEDDQQWKEFTGSSQLSKILPRFALDFYQAEIIMISQLTEFKLKEANPNIILRPKIPADVNIFLGFSHAANTIEIGEECTRQALPKIQKIVQPRLRLGF